MDAAERIAAQRRRVEQLETELWADGFVESGLASYQAAFRELEALIALRGPDRRRHFVVVIPVADSPQHLAACLSSLLTQCRTFAYGGLEAGRFRKVTVLLADDSADPDKIRQNRSISGQFERAGISIHYFGLDEQLALLRRLPAEGLGGIVGRHPVDAFARKGQAMMRNIAYLKLAEMRARFQREMPGERLLFYTIDADQTFCVNVEAAGGVRGLHALNYFYWLDRLFDDGAVQVLTGKVVGDPPVSPAVMAGNFLKDVLAFLRGLRDRDPDAAYRQPRVGSHASGEAAYHDMAQLFGFAAEPEPQHYRCRTPGAPSNSDCFVEFAQHLKSFLHGEHPTRVTWFRYQSAAQSIRPARTVYTGNYAFTAEALCWFIPFAPLRLRMSGPTLGRLLRAEMGVGFVSANLPMLHGRTLAPTRESEFRPGVLSEQGRIDLRDEMERQFYGDVMLFSIERLSADGYPDRPLERRQIEAVLDAVHTELSDAYRTRQALISARLEELRAVLHEPAQWWNRVPALDGALSEFAAFVENIEHNFGIGSSDCAPIDALETWPAWRERQLDAIQRLPADRLAWRRALAQLQRTDNT
jgi:hypothetical protein